MSHEQTCPVCDGPLPAILMIAFCVMLFIACAYAQYVKLWGPQKVHHCDKCKAEITSEAKP